MPALAGHHDLLVGFASCSAVALRRHTLSAGARLLFSPARTRLACGAASWPGSSGGGEPPGAGAGWLAVRTDDELVLERVWLSWSQPGRAQEYKATSIRPS